MHSDLVVAQISDLHIKAESGQYFSGYDTEYAFHSILQKISEQHPQLDLLLITGDLAQDPCHASYNRIYQTLKQYPFRCICLPGNHDDFNLMQQIFCDEKINCNPVIHYNHWQIICLNSKKHNSPGGYLAETELLMLDRELNKKPELNTLLAVHHPPVKIHSEWLDTMMIENSEQLFSVLAAYPQVKAICCGHIHQTLAENQADIQILATPSTCFQFKPLSKNYELDDANPGYQLLSLQASGLIKAETFRMAI